MKRVVDSDIGLGISAAVATMVVVAITGTGVTGIYLIGAAFLTIGLMIHEPPPRIQRWLQRRGGRG